MFKMNDLLKHIPSGDIVFVEGIDRDFITVVDGEMDCHVVMPEDYDKYEVLR